MSTAYRATIGDYLQLTKPTIMLLVLFTGASALVVEGSFLTRPLDFLLVLLGLYLTGGSANALNQYFERDIDSRMSRTKERRPLPQGKISPKAALLFSVSIGAIGVLLFAYFFNMLVAALAMGTILFYSLIYTLLLKPNTAQNIVIGGAAGAMAPVGAWVAATGHFSWIPWIMFAIVFFWTPPHFWALALFCKDDYIKAKLPMMPVVAGDRSTRKQMLTYTVIVILTSLSLLFFGAGWLYATVAIFLGGWFLKRGIEDFRLKTEQSARKLFGVSILYLFALFTAIMLDHLLINWHVIS